MKEYEEALLRYETFLSDIFEEAFSEKKDLWEISEDILQAGIWRQVLEEKSPKKFYKKVLEVDRKYLLRIKEIVSDTPIEELFDKTLGRYLSLHTSSSLAGETG